MKPVSAGAEITAKAPKENKVLTNAEKNMKPSSEMRPTKDDKIPRVYVVIVFELCTIFSGGTQGLQCIIWPHVWALFYSIVGLYLESKESLRVEVDGYPKFCYLLAWMNHGMLPIPVILAYLYSPNFVTWLDSPLMPSSYGAQVFYSIMGCMLKDAWLTKEYEKNVMNLGLFIHHVASISGCVLSLSLVSCFGYATLVGVVAELGSACYILYVLYPSRSTLAVYLAGMAASNWIGWVLTKHLIFEVTPIQGHLYLFFFSAIITFRIIGWVLVIVFESSPKAKATERAAFFQELFASLGRRVNLVKTL